jgi:hypothetical protein
MCVEMMTKDHPRFSTYFASPEDAQQQVSWQTSSAYSAATDPNTASARFLYEATAKRGWRSDLGVLKVLFQRVVNEELKEK